MSDDLRIRKVKVLGARCRKQAEEMGLNPEDLVCVKVTIKSGRPPDYDLTKIEGSPVEWLKKNYLGEREEG